MKNIKTRFAPSPTGSLHIGSLRTALYSYALAKHVGGKFILRIEDTDKKREVEGSREEIESQLKSFGIFWDEYHVQSERKSHGVYEKVAKILLDQGNAFYCQCEARNAKKEGYSKVLRDPCRGKYLKSGAVKLKVPDGEMVSYTDYILGKEIKWDTSDVNDATLLKSNGFPTYHLAVVADDHEMNITHALRGYDWLPSTPIHLLVYKYLKYELPEIGHLTDILDPGGGKLSKRKGSVSVNNLLVDGYVRGALLNFVMLLGWAPKDNREFFSMEEFVKAFEKSGFQKSNPVFNREKLDWFNSQYIQKMSDSSLAVELSKHFPDDVDNKFLEKVSALIKTRIKRLPESKELAGFFFERPEVDKKLLGENGLNHLRIAKATLESVTNWKLENINAKLTSMIEENNFKTGDFYMSLRIAITGKKFTPPINESIEILGKEETLKRLKHVIGR